MKVFDNYELTSFNSYRLKSTCKKALFPESEDDLFEIISNNEKYLLIGNGNNILLSKEYYEDTFIIFNGNFDSIEVSDKIIIAEAGASLEDISNIAMINGLSGLEPFYDIPSSIGGGISMNAGTKEGEIKDIVKKVRYLDLSDMKFKELEKDVIDFQYRNSYFQNHKDKIVTKVWFNLNKGNPVDIYKRMQETKSRRWEKQPRDFPNCGSVFKRPPGKFVGPMIEELGLKGYSIGGAKISEKHAGFIINYNGATGDDILKLIEYVRSNVQKEFGIELEVEQRII